MIGIVIVAHGGLAREYLSAVEHVVGPQSGIRAVTIEEDHDRVAKQAEICHAANEVDTGDGVVIFAGWQRGYGNVIKLQHAMGTETRYSHLSKIRVKAGQKVSRNSLIGDMGNTGRSTGPHLHYEVRVDGKAVNPMSFIKAAQNVF